MYIFEVTAGVVHSSASLRAAGTLPPYVRNHRPRKTTRKTAKDLAALSPRARLRLASQKEAEAAKKKRRAAEADQKRAGAALAFSILTGTKQPIDLPSIGTTKHTILTEDDTMPHDGYGEIR